MRVGRSVACPDPSRPTSPNAECGRYARTTAPAPPVQHLLTPVRQLIEPVNDTLTDQPDLEPHRGRTINGVTARTAQPILALTAAI